MYIINIKHINQYYNVSFLINVLAEFLQYNNVTELLE